MINNGDHYQALENENQSLRKAIIHSKQINEKVHSDFEALKQIHEDLKLHYEKCTHENNQLKQRIVQSNDSKKEMEAHFENIIRNLKSAIDQKQREIEET